MNRIRHLASTLSLAALLLLSLAAFPTRADAHPRCARPNPGYGYGGYYQPATVGVVMPDGTILKVAPQQVPYLEQYGGRVFSPYSTPAAPDGGVYSSAVQAWWPQDTNASSRNLARQIYGLGNAQH